IAGVVRNVRSGKNTSFVDLADGSCAAPIQIVLDNTQLPLPPGVLPGASLTVTGVRTQPFNKKKKDDDIFRIEFRASRLDAIGPVTDTTNYLLLSKNLSLESLRG